MPATVRTGRVQTAIGTNLTLTIRAPIVTMRNTNETLPHKTETSHDTRPEAAAHVAAAAARHANSDTNALPHRYCTDRPG